MPDHVPLPPVRQVAGGTWTIPVALPGSPLHYVIVHALETARGIVLVDAGWASEESWQALLAGLAAMGAGMADVVGVLVTHVHPDHYGLAPRVRRKSGAWVSLHPADLHLLKATDGDASAWLAGVGRWLERAGAPAGALADAELERDLTMRILRSEPPDLLLNDGDRAPLVGRELVVVHTPGHTDGHVCFHEAGRGLLYAGDHVLVRITPNVSSMSSALPDPLGSFLASLRAVRDLPDVAHVLPAHVTDFTDLPGRVDELLAHHEERLDDIAGHVEDGAETVWELAAKHPWKRGWEGLTPFMRRAALGETEAHLLHLAARGRVVAGPLGTDGVLRWLAAP